MAPNPTDERRLSMRSTATLRLTFRYAGRHFVAITTDVSSKGATIVAPVQLPKGAMIIFEAKEDQQTEGQGAVKLIAQVVWTGPAPFGGSQAHSAGLEFLRASADSWAELLAFLRSHLQREVTVEPMRLTERPALDLRESVASDSNLPNFEVLFNAGDVWLRGDLSHANNTTLWVATKGMTPRPGAPIQLRIGIRSPKGRAALLIHGRVPGNPIADNRGNGWIFECEIERLDRPDLYERLIAAIDGTGPSAK
jgi:hypothetical protein